MEILDLRHFTSSGLRTLLEQETSEWARSLEWDFASSAEMVLRYMDAKILPGYAAVEEGQVLGFSFFVYEGSKGVIGDLFADPRLEPEVRANVERELAQHVLETLQNSPGIHRIEAQLLLHEAGRLWQVFSEAGFLRYPRLFMRLPLENGKKSANASGGMRGIAWSGPLSTQTAVSAPADIELRAWSEEDFQSSANVITAAYRGRIDAEINDQYRTTAGSMRFLNNIVRFPGCGVFDPNSSLVARSRTSKATVGMILCSTVRQDVAHVTQICVLPEQRERGIAKALLHAACAGLQRRHMTALTLTVTEANENAVALYRRLGFSVERRFDALVWEG